MEDSTEDIPLCFVKKQLSGVETFRLGIIPLLNQVLRPVEKCTRKNKRIENVDSVQ